MARLGKIEREIIRQLTEHQPKALREIVQVYCSLRHPSLVSLRSSRSAYESFRRAAWRLREKRRVIIYYGPWDTGRWCLWLTRSRRLKIGPPFSMSAPIYRLSLFQRWFCRTHKLPCFEGDPEYQRELESFILDFLSPRQDTAPTLAAVDAPPADQRAGADEQRGACGDADAGLSAPSPPHSKCCIVKATP